LKGLGRAFPVLFLLPALVCLSQLVFPDLGIFHGPRPTAAATVASLSKMILLGCCAFFSFRNARALESADHDIASAWLRLAVGWLLYCLGQVTLGWYQIVKGTDAPFPSLGDAFFLLAYPCFLAALLAFLHVYRAAGFGVGTLAQQWALAGAVGVSSLTVAIPLLRPALAAPTSTGETALNLAYPVLDLALVVPLVLLMRVAFALRGGSVAGVWGPVLGGFAFMCVADVLFAHFSALGKVGLDPYVHATYIVSYGLVAEGARRQGALVAK
jgi:hypothetical protein